MGLFSGLLLLPLAPVRGVCWISGVMQDEALSQMYDPGVLRARLAVLHRAYDDGEIDDERFEAEEEHLLDLLDRPAHPRSTTHPPSKGAR
ncbi:gas vesicle protein GvpG [Streptomyces sp. NPDC021224]|uniref:gas vesicle protein GvpG n=1 Tax=unclassified Streptomyces TaxID=2593676 RepID=UPI0037BD0CC3